MNKIKIIGIFSALLILGFVFTGCKEKEIDVSGTWEGTIMTQSSVIEVTENNWTLSVQGWQFDKGSFTRDGNNFKFVSDNLKGKEVGTAAVTKEDPDTIKFTLSEDSEIPGEYTFKRKK